MGDHYHILLASYYIYINTINLYQFITLYFRSPKTDEGKRKHFEHSVTQNTSLDYTIEELERQRDLGVVGQEIVDTVKNHKKRMEDILRRVKNGELEYPSENI